MWIGTECDKLLAQEAEARFRPWIEENHPTFDAILDLGEDNKEIPPLDRRDKELLHELADEMQELITRLDRDVRLPQRGFYAVRPETIEKVRVESEIRFGLPLTARFIERCLEEKRALEVELRIASKPKL